MAQSILCYSPNSAVTDSFIRALHRKKIQDKMLHVQAVHDLTDYITCMQQGTSYHLFICDMSAHDAALLQDYVVSSAPLICMVAHGLPEANTLSCTTLLIKPFRLVKCIQLIQDLLIQSEDSLGDPLKLTPTCYLYPQAKMIMQAQEAGKKKNIYLTEKEADLLLYLYQAAGKPVAKQELLAKVWGYHPDTDTHTIDTHLYRLRTKLGEEIIGHAEGMILLENYNNKEE